MLTDNLPIDLPDDLPIDLPIDLPTEDEMREELEEMRKDLLEETLEVLEPIWAMIQGGFKAFVKDPAKLREVSSFIRKSKKSINGAETFGDLTKVYKGINEHFAVLAELEAANMGRSPEEKRVYVRLRNLFEIYAMGIQFVSLDSSGETTDMEDELAKIIGTR